MAISLNQLNLRQREAVLHRGGPLLILAGAGSGKTTTMAYRVAHLMADRHVPGSDILGLSFTNKAAKELRERVIRLVRETGGRKAAKGLTITTFHSLCARLLREHAEVLGFQKNFTILDQNDQSDILRQVLRNIRIDDRKFDIQQILFEIGQAKNRFLQGERVEEFFLESGRMSSDYAIATASAWSKYQDQLKILNGMDFDDLIYYTVLLLKNHSEIRDHYNARFRYVLVDEYQDTNPSQFQILQYLTQRQKNLCVVGDDDQSIYAWRGADAAHILQFKKHYPEAQVITLDQNYRSTSHILDAANSVISKNKNRYDKNLWSDRGVGEPLLEILVEEDRAEAEYVSEEILKRSTEQNKVWKDFAILYRSNTQSRVFEEALRIRQIPYKIVGGYSFLDRKEVKDILSYWKLISNTKDDASLRRVLNWPPRGIGKTSFEQLGKEAFEKNKSIFEIIDSSLEIAPKALKSSLEFKKMILELQNSLTACSVESIEMANWAKQSLEKMNAKKALDEECEDPVQSLRKWENIEELLHSIGQFNFKKSLAETENFADKNGLDFLREYLNRMILDEQENEKEEDSDTQKNQVTLLTLHGAKGLEFPIVFLVGMEEGLLPHQRTLEEATDLDEERRLCYVGITRAKDHLFLIRAKNRIRYGKPVVRIPSRFLEEIPIELKVKVDQSLNPDFSSQAQRVEHEEKVSHFLNQIRANLTGKER